MGDPADEGYERSALRELASSLTDERGDFSIFANFTVGAGRDSKQIDLLVVHGKSWTIVELKNSASYAVFGESNGPWKRSDGVEFPGQNPALQVIKQYSTLRKWLHTNRRDFVEPGRLAACREAAAWSDIRKFIALYPCRNPNSKIDVSGHPGFSGTLGDVIGFDLVKEHLLEPKWQGNLRLELTQGELERLAGIVGLSDAAAEVLAASTATPLDETPSNPDAPHDETHDLRKQEPGRTSFWRRLALSMIPLLVVAAIVSYLWWPRLNVIEATEAWQYIASDKKVTVCVEIGLVNENGRDRIIFDERITSSAAHNFSFEINEVGDSLLPFDANDTILIGPVKMGTSESGEAQIEIDYDELSALVRVK